MTAYFTDRCTRNGKSTYEIVRVTRNELIFIFHKKIHLILEREDVEEMDETDYFNAVNYLGRLLRRLPEAKAAFEKLIHEDQFDGMVLDIINDAIYKAEGGRIYLH